MKMRCILPAAALALLLCGCQGAGPVESEPAPPPETAPVQPVETPTPPPEEPAPSETPVPSEEPAPTAGPSDPLEELLAQQPIDDGHDAFLVHTGGRLGTLLVTAELGEREQDLELREIPLYLTVWNPADMREAIQEMESTVFNVFHWRAEVDANFDGYMDFSYTYAMGNQPCYAHLWIWDEDAGQFVEVPEYAEISTPYCDPETEVIDGWARYSGGGDGLTTFHRWEDGKLVCVRRIETGYDDENRVIINEVSHFPSWIRVEDRIDGELTQVYYRYYAADEGTDFFPERMKWEHLDYHGET